MRMFAKYFAEANPQPSSLFLYFTGSMRRSSPVVVVSLLILIIALGFSTVGNTKRDVKTVFGAMLYVIGGKYE